VRTLWLALAVWIAADSATATPVALTRTEFDALAAIRPTVVEDFDSFDYGVQPTPLSIANGIYTASGTAPFIYDSSEPLGYPQFCKFGTGNCLTGVLFLDPGIERVVRKFDSLPIGSIAWGVDLSRINGNDLFDMTVVGVSGTLTLNLFDFGGDREFVGFRDDQGLVSVSFANRGAAPLFQGATNYSFDNVSVVVPEPSTSALLALGIGALARGWPHKARARAIRL
jgi:hypothetical protein